MDPREQRGTFDIGLVLAGAVSGGAYTAGVVDFLIQALREWEKAKTERPGDPDIPRHVTRLKVLSGASAGGMTAAVLAASLFDGFDPVTGLAEGQPAPVNNRLYGCWVDRIDIGHLLADRDLRADPTLVSLLDSTILDDIAAYGFGAGGSRPGPARPWVGDPLELILTVANLRGIPYGLPFAGENHPGHELLRHQDEVRFVLGPATPETSPADAVHLDPATRQGPGWELFFRAGLATGAFPLGLAPRVLVRQRRHYDRRRWDVPEQTVMLGDGKKRVTYGQAVIMPAWGEKGADGREGDDVTFLAVDGGLMNNEPFELARKALAGDDPCNPRGLGDVKRAVLMVDPFPGPGRDRRKGETTDRPSDVVEVAARMFSALLAQARFKPEELALALNAGVYSRFLIAPGAGSAASGRPPMAAAALGGFGGFLTRKFRRYDFQLGRRDCQRFLRDHFVLPLEGHAGPAFQAGHSPMAANIELVKANPVFRDSVDFATFWRTDSTGARVLPIIPLCGAALPEVPLIPRAGIRMTGDELAALRLPIQNRLTAVATALSFRTRRVMPRWIVRTLFQLKKKAITAAILDAIRADLAAHGLFEA